LIETSEVRGGEPLGIVLAAFGAKGPEALEGILNILGLTREAYPRAETVLAFTSNQIRAQWCRRISDPSWLERFPGVPEEVLRVQGPLAAIANLQDRGIRNIVVQPLHVYAGEEFNDLKSYIQGLNSITTMKPRWMPFGSLALGRPALGQPGPLYPYLRDIQRAAEALGGDVEKARAEGAALVYVGHGNPYYSTGVYSELEQALRQKSPGLKVAIGLVEGSWDIDHVCRYLEQEGAKKVLLKPLMVVAGDHARNDICGPEAGSWRSVLESRGFEVVCELTGLGQLETWARIYLDNIRDAAREAGLGL